LLDHKNNYIERLNVAKMLQKSFNIVAV